MDNNANNNIPILQILWITLIAFFCSFSKKLNEYAKTPKDKQNFMLFVSEILLSGVCGTLLGVLTLNFFKSIYVIAFIAGIGGLLGLQLLKFAFKVFLVVKNVDISKVNVDDLDK